MSINSNLNNFNQNVNESLASSLVADAMKSLHNNVKSTVRANLQSDIYEDLRRIKISKNLTTFTEKQAQKRRNAQLAIVLKEVLERVLLEYQEEFYEEEDTLKIQIEQLGLEPTHNQNFAIDRAGFYYELVNNEYVKREEIVEVKENGDFVVKEVDKSTRAYFLTTIGSDNKPVAYQYVNRQNVPVASRELVARIFSLKKEWAKKYKLRGVSGGSANICRRALNALSPLHTTGCYMDVNYNFFRWNARTSSFEIEYRTGMKSGAPTIADYEFFTDKIVRTDYDGCAA